jgi:hypothetical protein
MIQYFPIVTGSLTVLGNINVSGSITTSGSITISGSITSASFATSASNATNAISASYANNLTVAGTLTAQTIVVQTITSSVDFVTGSTRFGSIAANTHVFTGSIYTSGSIGIGTNSPGQLLEVYAADGGGIRLKNSGSADKRWDFALSGNDLRINEVGVTAVMTIKAGGNIGIGTTSPDNKLHIISDAAASTNNYALRLQNTTTVADGRVGIAFLDNSNTGGSGSGATIQVSNNGVDGTGNLLFGTLLNGTNTERMRIDSNGRLGIGISGPAFLLDVGGGVNGVTQNVCRIGNAAGYTNGLTVSKDASNFFLFDFGPSSILRSLYTYNNTSAAVANVSVSAGGTFERYVASSQRFKQNITDWNASGLDTILALKPKIFKYKKDYYNKADVDFLGLIAEEVAEVSPYLADYENEDRTGQVENVRYANIVVPLIKALQELNTKFEEYKATHP